MQSRFNTALNIPQTFIQTIHELSSFGVEFDESVREKLSTDLSDEQVKILCDKSAQVLLDKSFGQFTELVTLINKWPVVIENFSVSIITSDRWKAQFAGWDYFFEDNLSRIEPTMKPTIYNLSPGKSSTADFSFTIPWLIAYSGFWLFQFL